VLRDKGLDEKLPLSDRVMQMAHRLRKLDHARPPCCAATTSAPQLLPNTSLQRTLWSAGITGELIRFLGEKRTPRQWVVCQSFVAGGGELAGAARIIHVVGRESGRRPSVGCTQHTRNLATRFLLSAGGDNWCVSRTLQTPSCHRVVVVTRFVNTTGTGAVGTLSDLPVPVAPLSPLLDWRFLVAQASGGRRATFSTRK
jgi:hypothetical protein